MTTRLVDLTPHMRAHETDRRRATFATGAPAGAPVSARRWHEAPPSGPVSLVEMHREALENLRRLAVHLETAALLERRANRSTDPAQAAALRDRAEERRRISQQLRAHLTGNGLPRTTQRRR